MADHSIVDVAGISEGESSNNSSKIAGISEGESSNNSSKIAGISEGESSNNRSSSSKPCIFKVPGILRRHSPKSFTPNSFSFGPLHHAQEHLKEAEGIKRQYLRKFLSRKRTDETTRDIENFKNSILEVGKRARKCYAFPTNHLTEDEFVYMLFLENSILEVEERARKCYAFSTDNLNKDEFVQMLILDGCFIIELLRKNEIYTNNNNSSSSINNNSSSSNNNNNNTLEEDDPVFSVSWVLQVLYHDLILLENQIPWFVLEKLFEMTSETIPDSRSLTDLALHFIRPNFSKCPLPQIEGIHETNHILCQLRNALISKFGTVQESTSEWQLIPTATSLRESGIRFKKVESSKLLDIKFVKHGVLEIPSLTIQTTTCEMLRNLISYEQCYPNCEPKITSYAILLNNLISTTKDIEVLHEAGIVVNYLNPNDTLEFFNNIYTNTHVKTFYYVEICQKVKQYTDQWWPRTKAAVVHNLFFNPLVIASQIVAGVVVFLTILQTVFTVAQYFKKDSSTFTSVLKTLRYTNPR